ncbi:MAG: hypothetical protein J6C43_04050 [Oscillospiraceae bacterium]|nr:hypothetical protein [Oscillospiraceae bacterium]MBP3319559.1 hypothetical protein [Ruminiclostridium sp.]MBP3519720.1 hypothetical protein [Oscillospiraceae bacterium]
MNKNYARFLSALFCGFLAVLFTANALTPDKEFSQVENRALAQKPQITGNTFQLPPLSGLFTSDQGGDFFTGKLMSDYETYTIDQFVLRDTWVAAKAYAEKLVGKKENNDVYFCADGSLITRFDEPDQKRLERNFGYVSKFAGTADIPVYFGLIPTQASVWDYKLPQGAPNYDQDLVLDAAQSAVTGATQIDLATSLNEHKEEAIFYRTDHHWTSLGAYYGYVALMEGLGRGDEVIPLENYTKTTVSTEFYGTVFSSSGVRWVKPDEMDTYVPEDGLDLITVSVNASGLEERKARPFYDKSYLEVKDKYSMFLGGQQPLGIVYTKNTDKPKLLLIRDSYSDSLVPFLTPHFSEIHLIDLRYYKTSASEYIAKNGIDTAVVLFSVPNFVSESNLAFLR